MLTNKRILIIDDDVLIAEHLKSIIQSFGCSKIELAHTSKSAISMLQEFEPNIVLLDIRLEDKEEGITIGKKINEEFHIPFIYITAFSDNSIIKNALTTHPSSFITKPYKTADIFAALNLIYINNPDLNKAHISFKYGNEHIKLATTEIHLIEREGNYISIHCASKKYLLRNSIEWIVEQLPENIFVRVHRSFVVNIKLINKHTTEFVYVDNLQIPISRKTKTILMEKIASI
ncbi:MAG: LytR/AlgR family response regulator transcription factor [Chitinophagaceae bacterium]